MRLEATIMSNTSMSQRQRILAHLKKSPLTTLQARSELDVMHPAARVMELKVRGGHKIVTHWTTDNAGGGNHRVAQYVLMAGGENGS